MDAMCKGPFGTKETKFEHQQRITHWRKWSMQLHRLSPVATFQDSVSGTPKQSRHSTQMQSRWSPPPTGMIKVNFDGALFRDIRKAGIGVVVRDSNRKAIATLSEQASLPFSPEIAEAMAAARAVSFVQGLGFTSFILEGDSDNVINTLKSMIDREWRGWFADTSFYKRYCNKICNIFSIIFIIIN